MCCYCALGCTGKHLRQEREDPRCKLHGVPARRVAKAGQTEGEVATGRLPLRGKDPPHLQPKKAPMAAKGGSTSSEEEPESSVSATSEEDDPLRGEPNWRQLCRRIVRSCYRGQWANLVFDKTGKRLHVEEDAPEKGNFLRLNSAQTEKVGTQLMECATTPS